MQVNISISGSGLWSLIGKQFHLIPQRLSTDAKKYLVIIHWKKWTSSKSMEILFPEYFHTTESSTELDKTLEIAFSNLFLQNLPIPPFSINIHFERGYWCVFWLLSCDQNLTTWLTWPSSIHFWSQKSGICYLRGFCGDATSHEHQNQTNYTGDNQQKWRRIWRDVCTVTQCMYI